MRTISKKELEIIIKMHSKWFIGDAEGKRANLSDADLRGADLSDAYLRGANLRGADLRGADLRGADLSGANLSDADLSDAYLSDAYLSGANLSDADLSDADLSDADLRGADLSDAYLRGANLRGADLSDANLSDANLRGAKIHWPFVCPKKGSFIGFKKAGGYVVELEVTYDALRSSATTRKCRCSKAKVISITNYDGTDSGVSEVASNRDHSFIYKVGGTVEVDNFDTNRWNECSTGIHFFITRQEAVYYIG